MLAMSSWCSSCRATGIARAGCEFSKRHHDQVAGLSGIQYVLDTRCLDVPSDLVCEILHDSQASVSLSSIDILAQRIDPLTASSIWSDGTLYTGSSHSHFMYSCPNLSLATSVPGRAYQGVQYY